MKLEVSVSSLKIQVTKTLIQKGHKGGVKWMNILYMMNDFIRALICINTYYISSQNPNETL